MPTVQQLKAEAQEVKHRYEKESARLYSGGRTVFPAAEHEEREKAIRGERDQTLKAIEKDARHIREEIVESFEVAREFAPDEVLSTSERSQARERMAAISDDVTGLNASALKRRLEGILASGSKVERFCYLQAARKRDREDQQRRSERSESGPGNYRGIQPSPFGGPLSQLEDAVLGGERTRREEELEARIASVNEVLEYALFARHEAKSYAGVHAARRHHNASSLGLARPGVPASGGGGRIAPDRTRQQVDDQ